MENRGIKLILGVGGQDGQNLSNYLLDRGDKVVGVVRRSSQPRRYLNPLIEKGLELIEGDGTDLSSLSTIFKKYRPEHIYAIFAQSHVATSFSQPLTTFDTTGKGILNVLEAMKSECPNARMYNAASSEMFGSNYTMEIDYDQYSVPQHFNIKETKFIDLWMSNTFAPTEEDKWNEYNKWIKKGWEFSQPYQDESTPMSGNSPYGIAKLAAYQMTRLYRESYGLFCCSGILFNHEGKYRSLTFVTRKITNYVSRLVISKKYNRPIEKLKLGNLDACRDWMDARDAVRAMVLMLEADKPDDYVVGTGLTWSVKDFAEKAFNCINEDYKNHIELDKSLIRPCEVDYLRAKPDKIKYKLGWKPEITFDQMINDMVNFDIERTEKYYKMYGDI